jgi:hypothetical protein
LENDTMYATPAIRQVTMTAEAALCCHITFHGETFAAQAQGVCPFPVAPNSSLEVPTPLGTLTITGS